MKMNVADVNVANSVEIKTTPKFPLLVIRKKPIIFTSNVFSLKVHQFLLEIIVYKLYEIRLIKKGIRNTKINNSLEEYDSNS